MPTFSSEQLPCLLGLIIVLLSQHLHWRKVVRLSLIHKRNTKHFQASQPDELTIEEQEILEVIDDGDMEDWLKVGCISSE